VEELSADDDPVGGAEVLDEPEPEVADDTDPDVVVETGAKLPYEVVTLPSESVLTPKDRDSVRLVTRPSERVATKTPKRSVLIDTPVREDPLLLVVVVPDEVVLAFAGKTEKEVNVEDPLAMTTGEEDNELAAVVVKVPLERAAEFAAEMMAGTRLVG